MKLPGCGDHRALRRRTPIQTYNDRPIAFPTGYRIPPHYRGRHHRIDDRNVRVLDHTTGPLIRELILGPTRDYQPRGVKCGNSPESRP